MASKKATIEDFVGMEFDFYGVDGYKFMLDSHLFHAIEDENDGYRSHLQTIEEVPNELFIFPGKPFARVRLETYEHQDQDGYRLVDADDGHVWLRVGTDNTDDYYPYFVFEYSAKPPKHQGG